ncbi:MAG: hypothetical protein ACOZF0_23735 [Thermodesulfobacteriota bacterium]
MNPAVRISAIPLSELKGIAALAEYEPDGVSQRELSRNEALAIHLFAVEKGHTLEPVIGPGEALLQILEGGALVTVGGNEQAAEAGRTMVLPAGLSCRIKASRRLKILLTVIQKPELIGIEPSET